MVIRLCCGKQHTKHPVMCDDLQVMCCLCFNRVPLTSLTKDDQGELTDVCRDCKADIDKADGVTPRTLAEEVAAGLHDEPHP